MNKELIIKELGLSLHPKEGGYFKRTYESSLNAAFGSSQRRLLTSIYYLLTDDEPIGFLHKNKSDIIHYYHLGSSVRYLLLDDEGKLEEKILGPNLDRGEELQLLVPGGFWKASRIMGGEFALISEAVSPGFEYEDNELADLSLLSDLHPEIQSALLPYLKDSRMINS